MHGLLPPNDGPDLIMPAVPGPSPEPHDVC